MVFWSQQLHSLVSTPIGSHDAKAHSRVLEVIAGFPVWKAHLAASNDLALLSAPTDPLCVIRCHNVRVMGLGGQYQTRYGVIVCARKALARLREPRKMTRLLIVTSERCLAESDEMLRLPSMLFTVTVNLVMLLPLPCVTLLGRKAIVRTVHNEREWARRRIRKLLLTNLINPLAFTTELGVSLKVVDNLNHRPIARLLGRRAQVMYNALDFDRFDTATPIDRLAKRDSLGLPPECFVVGSERLTR